MVFNGSQNDDGNLSLLSSKYGNLVKYLKISRSLEMNLKIIFQ